VKRVVVKKFDPEKLNQIRQQAMRQDITALLSNPQESTSTGTTTNPTDKTSNSVPSTTATATMTVAVVGTTQSDANNVSASDSQPYVLFPFTDV
jgi:hypothetical protein